MEISSCLIKFSWVSVGDTPSLLLALAPARRPPLGPPTLFAAAMVACNEVRSRIMRSFWSCLSACTVCAC